MSIEFSLIAPGHRNKTVVYFGIQFTNGKARLPDTGSEVVQRVLREDFGAMPTAEAIEKGLIPDPDVEAKAALRKEIEAENAKAAAEAKRTADEAKDDEDDVLGDEKPADETEKPKRKRNRG